MSLNFLLVFTSSVLIVSAFVEKSFAEVFTSNIDAAFFSDADNKIYLLKGDQYVRLTFIVGQGATIDQGYPQPISNWSELPH